MSMPALVFDEDDPLFDPDELKMPESPAHRQTVDAIALAAVDLLGPDQRVFRDMNWYPDDGGSAVAPDIMVLPADALPLPPGPVVDWPRSYQQGPDDPVPSVVVEVPSKADDVGSLFTKAHRCRRLGAVVYLVLITASPPEVYRFSPDQSGNELWVDRPIPELAGLSIGFDDGMMVVAMPDGLRISSDGAMNAELRSRANQAEARSEQAEARSEALARKLRELGIDPSTIT